MNKKEFTVFSQKSDVELNKSFLEFKDKLWDLRKDLKMGKVKNIKSIKEARKDIARVLTILNSKKDLLRAKI